MKKQNRTELLDCSSAQTQYQFIPEKCNKTETLGVWWTPDAHMAAFLVVQCEQLATEGWSARRQRRDAVMAGQLATE